MISLSRSFTYGKIIIRGDDNLVSLDTQGFNSIVKANWHVGDSFTESMEFTIGFVSRCITVTCSVDLIEYRIDCSNLIDSEEPIILKDKLGTGPLVSKFMDVFAGCK